MKRCNKTRNRVFAYFLLALIFTRYDVCAQTDTIIPRRLFICCNKTSSLVFPQMIKIIDRGSSDVLAQKVEGAEHILLLKAAKEDFTETNLTVITADGMLYSFLLNYVMNPAVLTVEFNKQLNIFQRIAVQKRSLRGLQRESFDIKLQVMGIYIENDILYFQLNLQNRSTISYDIDFLRFYIKDKKQNKRTSSQELEQNPVYVYGNIPSVEGLTSQTMVVAFPKFTIPDKKRFYLQLMERNGGRHVSIQLGNPSIVQAKRLP